jgi:release factor glutamine methyltransferase
MFLDGCSLSIKKAIFLASSYLSVKHPQTARLDSEILLSYLLSCRRIDLYKNYYQNLSSDQIKTFSELVKRRYSFEPIAYILGKKEFFSLDFFVNKDVLIPRPDTEIIVEEIINDFKDEDSCALDLCTGTGCIGISLLKNIARLNLVGVDVCDKALRVAKQNIINHKVERRFSLQQDSVLEDSFWQTQKKVDFIVVNPPYVSEDEQHLMPQEVKLFEPSKALFAENFGLLFYQVLAKKAQDCLLSKGKIYLEIPPQLCSKIVMLFCENRWQNKKIKYDYSKKARLLCFEKSQ